jgi:hypothetical protein
MNIRQLLVPLEKASQPITIDSDVEAAIWSPRLLVSIPTNESLATLEHSTQEDVCMTYDNRTLSMVVHAPSKIGKSSLAATCPRPILVLDAEGGWKFMANAASITAKLGRPLLIAHWDPSQPPPRADGTWDVCVVTVRAWSDVQLVYQWLTQGQHDFVSLVMDSVTEIQRRAKANLKGTDAMQIQDWGALLTVMDTVIRGFRDLTIDSHNPIRVAVFVAETRQINGKWTPYMQGQIATSLPYWVDLTGWLFVEHLLDANGQPTLPERRLLVAQHPMYEAGERVQGAVGPVIANPDIEAILEAIYPQYSPPTVQEVAQ